MKFFLYGCLIPLIVVGVIGGIWFHNTFLKPEDIVFKEVPSEGGFCGSSGIFPGKKVCDQVNELDGQVLYEISWHHPGLMDGSSAYVAVIDAPAKKLQYRLPVQEEHRQVFSRVFFGSYGQPFNPVYEVPENEKVTNGNFVSIYGPEREISLPLQKGYYAIGRNGMDNLGSVEEMLIYDADTGLWLYGQDIYRAFQ